MLLSRNDINQFIKKRKKKRRYQSVGARLRKPWEMLLSWNDIDLNRIITGPFGDIRWNRIITEWVALGAFWNL